MTIDLKVRTTLNGQMFEITAKDINDDPGDIKEVKKYLVNAAVFGVRDVCEKMNNNNNGASDTKSLSIKDVVKKQVEIVKPSTVNPQYADAPATEKQIFKLASLGYTCAPDEYITRSQADQLIKRFLAGNNG